MVWSTCSTPLNALPFLSFHKVHRRHKGAALHAFTVLLPTKVSFHPSKFPLTVKCITHLHIKKGENHIPQQTSFVTKQKKMVVSFFFIFTQETSIWHVPSPSFQLVGSQNSIPRRFPSKKKNHSHRSPRPPNDAPRERIIRSPCVGRVERTNKKNNQSYFLSSSKHPPHLF